MKRLIACALLALSSITFGATLVPIQLLNPAGCASGQVITSTGPSTAMACQSVALSGVTGTLAIANGGTGATSAGAALTNLGAAPLAGTNTWPNVQTFSQSPTVPTPATTDVSTKAVNSTWVNNLFAAPPAYGVSAPNALHATTIGATGLITPASAGIKGSVAGACAPAGSIGECPVNSAGSVALTNNTPANVTSVSLTAGNWLVSGTATITSSGGATMVGIVSGTNTTSATIGATGSYFQLGTTLSTNAIIAGALPVSVLTLTSTTTVFCVASISFSGGSVSGACKLQAVRLP